MQKYLDLMKSVLENGRFKNDRTGVGCYSIHGEMLKFDLTKGFPILTTKKMGIKNIAAELIWFLSGSTDNNDLNALGCHIWDEWQLPNGDLGPIYGKQWRDFNGVDQIKELILNLRLNPNSRRHIVTAWNPEVVPMEYAPIPMSVEERELCVGFELDTLENRNDYVLAENKEQYLDLLGAPRFYRGERITPQQNVEVGNACLPACHTLFQMHTLKLTLDDRLEYIRSISDDEDSTVTELIEGLVEEDANNELDMLEVPVYGLKCEVYLRSQDLALGTGYNIASYALLTHMVAQVTNMVPMELIWVGGDVHLYTNHLIGVKEQLTRKPFPLPKLQLNTDINDIFSFTLDDINLEGYQYHDTIKLEVAV